MSVNGENMENNEWYDIRRLYDGMMDEIHGEWYDILYNFYFQKNPKKNIEKKMYDKICYNIEDR